jgi:hypothetical protein
MNSIPTHMAALVFEALVMYGATFMVKDSKIFSGPRDWASLKSKFISDLMECPFCVGTWVGLGMGLGKSLLLNLDVTEMLATMLAYSLASASVSFILDLVTRKLELMIEEEE